MRIIAGEARGRSILAPKGQHTRPTQDYVRESLFNIIQRDVPDAVVLDLFSGSGALALEALSRGAKRAVLADKSRQAVECIRRNAETLRFTEQTLIVQGDWQTVLERLSDISFDLVFLDPPYQLPQYRQMTDALESRGLLKRDALIVIEHAKNVTPDVSKSFRLRDERTYGDTAIHLYYFNAGGSTDGH
ncbi:MAG: 16S rRNA (guanine(966)-N(2))-methyltransferase RsmD [Bacillota bacterium]